MIKYLLTYLLCLGIIFSCTENKINLKNIDIKENSFDQSNLSSIVDTVLMIPLETTDDCLLGNIYSIQRDDSLLFVEYDGIIYLFDIDGKFHKQLNYIGGGPGETWVLGYNLDKDNKQLVVFGKESKLTSYKYDGTLISEKYLDKSSFSYRNFILHNNSFWTIGTRYAGNESWILKLNREGDIQDSIMLFRPEMPKEFFSFFPFPNFSLIGNNLYVNNPSHYTDYHRRDTLYKVDNNRIIPELRVNYGNYPYRPGNPMIHGTSGYQIQPSEIRMNKRFLMTEYMIFKEKPPYDFYFFYLDFVTDKKYNLKGGFDDDIFHTGKVMPRPMDAYHKEFYFTKTAEEVSEILPGRDESDNPVVFIMQLKE